jgi:hypothetical protein
MKLSFPDKFVKSQSFIDLCNTVKDYGYNGVEICDVVHSISNHTDSIFRSSVTVDAKRKLVNRHIEIPAISYPKKINGNTDSQDVIKYVEFCSLASIHRCQPSKNCLCYGVCEPKSTFD